MDRTDRLIRLISRADKGRGYKLLQFMDEHGLDGLQNATEEQMMEFAEREGLVKELPDDPVVRSLERTGLPPWEVKLPDVRCPVCGGNADYFTLNVNGEIVGCDECLRTVDAMEYEQEKREDCNAERD